MQNLIAFKDIEVTQDGQTLCIANSRIRRVLDLSLGAPRTTSLDDSVGLSLASSEKSETDFSFIAMSPAGLNSAIPWTVTKVAADVVPESFRDSEHVRIALSMREEVSETEYLREYRIYPGFPAISVENSITSQVLPMLYWSNRGGLSKCDYRPDVRESCADSIRCADGILPEKVVCFTGRTDYNDDLIQERQADSAKLTGNLLFCRNASGAGFLFLQEAPPSGERRDQEEYDFRICDGTVFSCCWGIHPSELRPDRCFRGYRHDLLIYHSDEEREELLKEFLRKRFPEKPHSVMVNPWGCGHFPQLLSEEFLLREVQAAGAIGATSYQIDDGWQEGGSLSELNFNNRRITPQFWKISQERLGGSFSAVVKAAEAAGIRLGLWFAPSCNCEYRDWRVLAERILELHREYGFREIKIDAVMIRTSDAEENLRSLLDYVREATGGEVFFNLDTTNGQRAGYFLFLEYGNIFLENRYVCHLWGRGYHPEKTLQSLWRLSKYMRTQDLQIEVPYVGDINPEFYAQKPWCPPQTYPQSYWTAIALFANPLLWFAPSTVKLEDVAAIRAVLELHKTFRDEIFAGNIRPVGEAPDGRAVTGFISRNAATGKEYLLLFREAGSQEDRAEITIPCSRAAQWQVVAGDGRVLSAAPGSLCVALPKAAYLFVVGRC